MALTTPMATAAHTHTSANANANGRTPPTLNTHTYNHNYNMDTSAHRRTTSVDSSYSAFFTSGLLSPPSSPAMSPTSPTSPASPTSLTSTFPFTSPFTRNNHYNNPSSSRHNANGTRKSSNPKSSRMKVNVNVNPTHQLPSTSMLELASPSSSYGGDALYFVALLQQMEDDESTIDVGGEEGDVGGLGYGEGECGEESGVDGIEGIGGIVREGVEGEEENGKDLRELTSFLSLDAASASQYTRSTRTRTGGSGRGTGTGIGGSAASSSSTTARFPFPASPPLPSHSPRSPTASTLSTSTSASASTSISSTSASTSASVSPITPPSYPFSQHHHHQQHHPYHAYHAYHPHPHPHSDAHPHPYHADSNPLLHSQNITNVTKSNSHNSATITKPNANANADADGKNRQTGRTGRTGNSGRSGKTNEYPRSFLPSLRHHSPSHINTLLSPPLPPIPHRIPSPRDDAPSKGNTHTPTRIPSLTLPPPIVSSFVFDDSGDSDSDSDSDSDPDSPDSDCDIGEGDEGESNHVGVGGERNARGVGGERVGGESERDGRDGNAHAHAHAHPPRTARTARTGAHTAPLLASFPAPPPTSLALRLSLHLPKTSLFFDEDDLEDESDLVGGDEGEEEEEEEEEGETEGEGEDEDGVEGEGEGEGVRESYLSLTSPTSPPPQPQQQPRQRQGATRKPAHLPSHTRKPSTARRTVGSRKSSTRRTRTPTTASALSPALSPSFSAVSLSRNPTTLSPIPSLSKNPFTQSRSLSTKAKWRFVANGNGVNGKRFTQVSTTSSASVSTGYRTCMRADALAALEGRVLGSRGNDEIVEERKDGEDGEDLWEDDLEEEQGCDDDLSVDEARREGRGEMSWMDFNPTVLSTSTKSGGLSRGLSSKSYKWKSMYSMYSTSTTGVEGMMGGGGEGEDVPRGEGRPFSASSTSLPNLPFPSSSTHPTFPSNSTSTSTFASTHSIQPNRTSTLSSIQTSILSSQTIELDASSPTSTSSATAMLSPLSYTESFALRALSFALPSRAQVPPPSHSVQSPHTVPPSVAQPQPLASLTNHPSKGMIAGVTEKGKEKMHGREGKGMRDGRGKGKGKGMTSFMFIDADERTARRTREKVGGGGFGKSFIDF